MPRRKKEPQRLKRVFRGELEIGQMYWIWWEDARHAARYEGEGKFSMKRSFGRKTVRVVRRNVLAKGFVYE